MKIRTVSGRLAQTCSVPWTSMSRITSSPRSMAASTYFFGVP